jgi:hypothetical protein
VSACACVAGSTYIERFVFYIDLAYVGVPWAGYEDCPYTAV